MSHLSRSAFVRHVLAAKQDMLPYNDYFEYYGPDYRLHMPTSNMENMNKRETLEEVRSPSTVKVIYLRKSRV